MNIYFFKTTRRAFVCFILDAPIGVYTVAGLLSLKVMHMRVTLFHSSETKLVSDYVYKRCVDESPFFKNTCSCQKDLSGTSD